MNKPNKPVKTTKPVKSTKPVKAILFHYINLFFTNMVAKI